MSKTYRDMVRGKYRSDDKKFDKDPNNREMVWRHCYRLVKDGNGKWLKDENGKEIKAHDWYQCNDVKIELRNKTPWDLLSYKERMYVWSMHTPSWWICEFMTVKSRAKTRILLQRFKCNNFNEIEDVIFPLSRKPHIYYW